jgi:hypothetical protein
VETGGGGPAIPETTSVDPERYAQLDAYYTRTNPILEKYKDDFGAILEMDEDELKFTRTSRESYREMQARLKKEQEEAIPEGERRLMAHIDKRIDGFKPVLDDYASRAEREAATAKEASQEFAKKETEYANRLVAEQKLTSEEVNELAEYAMTLHQKSVKDGNPRFVGIEEVYKRVYGRAEAKVTAAKPVPRSQRAVAGATGVPGASRTIEDRSDLAKPGGVTRHILGVLNNQRKTG